MELIRTFDILNNLLELSPDKSDILAGKEKGTWFKYSVKEYTDMAEKTSFGLLALGLQKGDLVVTISNNRPDLIFSF
jgi:long-subunit acyl-CoA synthetase (AMP-forming)